MWKLNNTPPEQPMSQRRNQRRNLKNNLETNKNGITYQNLWDADKRGGSS